VAVAYQFRQLLAIDAPSNICEWKIELTLDWEDESANTENLEAGWQPKHKFTNAVTSKRTSSHFSLAPGQGQHVRAFELWSLALHVELNMHRFPFDRHLVSGSPAFNTLFCLPLMCAPQKKTAHPATGLFSSDWRT
jgi:hypothetical protein